MDEPQTWADVGRRLKRMPRQMRNVAVRMTGFIVINLLCAYVAVSLNLDVIAILLAVGLGAPWAVWTAKHFNIFEA